MLNKVYFMLINMICWEIGAGAGCSTMKEPDERRSDRNTERNSATNSLAKTSISKPAAQNVISNNASDAEFTDTRANAYKSSNTQVGESSSLQNQAHTVVLDSYTSEDNISNTIETLMTERVFSASRRQTESINPHRRKQSQSNQGHHSDSDDGLIDDLDHKYRFQLVPESHPNLTSNQVLALLIASRVYGRR